MWIWHLEHCYHLTSILGRKSWPNYPRHSLRTCLHHLLPDTHQPHTTPATWRCFIWTFCYCTKCSIYPAVITSRWRLWKWFQHSWLTNPLWKTPCIHHISSIEHASFDPAHTTPCCPATTPHCGSPWTPPRPVCCCLLFTSDSSVSDQDPDSSPEHSDEEEDFQTVPIDDEHWTTDIVLERTFCIHENDFTQQCMSIPMPLWEQSHCLIHGQLRLKWYFKLRGLHDDTSDDEELPGLEEVPYGHLNSGLLEHLLDI